MHQHSQSRHAGAREGFTLVEMLVVIGIIMIMAVSIGGILGGGEGGAGLKAAQRSMASMIQSARTVAVMKGQPARLIINNDPSNLERYLRYMGIIYEDPDNPGKWIADSQGTYLPRNTFFVPAKADGAAQFDITGMTDTGSNPFHMSDDAQGSLNITFPTYDTQSDDSNTNGDMSTGKAWFYYEFGPDGMASLGTANKKLVVMAADYHPDSIDTTKANRKVVKVNSQYQLYGAMISTFGGVTSFEYGDL